MAQFVNYKKRSFTLPPGCKNLIDVLEPSRRQTKGHTATGGFQPLEIREERFPTAGDVMKQGLIFVTMRWRQPPKRAGARFSVAEQRGSSCARRVGGRPDRAAMASVC